MKLKECGKNEILIIGGAHFLDSNLAYRYANNKENEVDIVDNLSTGKIENNRIKQKNSHIDI